MPMHEEGRTWEVTSLFRKLKVSHFPPCPLMRRGWLLTRLRLDAKRRSPPCCRHAGLLCAPSLGDARRDGEKVSPEVGLDDSRKTGGRASGGLGARPQSCVLAGPWPHGPETGRFQKRRQRRQLFLSRPA